MYILYLSTVTYLAYHQENTTMEGLRKHVRQLKGLRLFNMFTHPVQYANHVIGKDTEQY